MNFTMSVAKAVWYAANLPVETPLDWTKDAPSTGTIDDLDDPDDEREDENEAPVGIPSDEAEAPEEFERNEDSRGLKDPAVKHP